MLWWWKPPPSSGKVRLRQAMNQLLRNTVNSSMLRWCKIFMFLYQAVSSHQVIPNTLHNKQCFVLLDDFIPCGIRTWISSTSTGGSEQSFLTIGTLACHKWTSLLAVVAITATCQISLTFGFHVQIVSILLQVTLQCTVRTAI
jgi:hypothetical protein